MAWSFLKKVIEHLPSRHVEDRNLQIIKSVRSIVTDYLAMMNDEEGLYGIGQCTKFGSCCSEVAAQKREVIRQLQREIKEGRTDESAAAKPMADKDFEKLRTICGWNDATSITGCQMKDDTTRQWEWLADILTCVDAHLLDIERCHRILHDIQSCDVALVSDLRNTAFRTSPCNVPMNAEEIIIQIKKLATSLLRWLEKVESLLMRSRNTTIIRIGELPDSKATMVRCLCALRSNSVLVQKDEMLLLVDVTANNTLTLENNTKEHVSLPSLLCAALETDNVVKERAKKLQLSLLDGWTSCIIAVGRHIVSFLQISYQEWLQKKEIIKILTGSQSSTVVETVSSSEETFSVFAVTYEECKEFREIVRSVIKLLQNTENLDLNVTQLDTQVSCIRMTPNQLADLLEEYKTLRALWRSLQNTVGSSEIEDTLSPSHAPCIVEMGNDLPAVFDDVAETPRGDSEDLCVEVSCDELPSYPEVEAQYMHENVSPIAESFVYSSGNSKNFYSMESGIDMVSNAESVIDTESITDYAATYATADMESNFSIQESNMSDLSFHYEENQNESEHFRVSEDISRGIVDVLFSTPKGDKTNEVSGSEQECSIDFQQDTGRFAKHQEFHRNPSDTQIDVNIDSECFPSVETEHDELLLDNLDHSHNLNEVQSHPTNKHEGEGTLFLRETDCMMNSKQNSSVLDEEQGPVQSNLQNILCQENEVHDRDVQPEEIRLVNRNETEIHPSATLLTITNIMGHSDSCMMEYSSHDADEDHSIFPSNQCENTRFPSLNESQYDSLPNVEPCYSQSQIKEEFSITHDADSPSAILQDTLNCSFDSPKLQGVTKNSSLVHNVTVLSFRDEIISDPLSDKAKQLKAQEMDSIVHDELPIQQDHDEASIADNRLYQQSHSPQLQSISYTVTDQSLRLCEIYYSRTHAVSETGIKSEKCCINDHSQISASTENIKSHGYDNLPSDASMTQEISGIETFPQALVDINSDTTEDIPENEIVPPSPSIAGNTDDSKTINAAEAFDRNTKCDSDISDTNLVDFNTDIGDSLNESGYQTFYSESDISYSALEYSFNHHSEHSDKNGLTPDHTSDEKAGGNYGNKLCMNKQNPTNTEQFRYSATSENVIRSCVDISETQDFVDCVSRAETISSIDNTKTMQTTRDNLANRNTSQSQNIDNISESLDNTTVSLSPNDRVTISEINMTVESSTYSNSSQNDTFSADPQNVSTTCDSRETTQSQKSSDINDRCQLTSENIMKIVPIPNVVDNTISEDACGMMTSVGYITKGHQIVNNSDNVFKGSDEKRGEVIIENTEVEPEIVDTTVCYLTMNHELAEFTEMKQIDSDIIDQDISDNSPNVSLLGKKRKDIDIHNDSEMLDPSDINLSQRISDNTDMIPSNIDVTTNQIITATSTTSSVHDKQTRNLTDDSIENTTTVCNRSKNLDISDTPIMENSISDMIAIPDITNTTDDMQRVSEMTKKYDAQSIIVASPPISDNTARTAAINESQTNNDVSDNIGSSQAVIEMYSDADKTDLLIQNVSNINASHNISDTSESVTTVVNSLISEAITDDTKIFPSPNNAFTTHGVSSTIESMSSLTSTLTSDSISDNIEMISSENDITECSDILESTDKLSSSRLLTTSSMNSEQRDVIETEIDTTTGNDASDTTRAMLFDSDISTDPCITDKTEMKPMTIGLVNHKDASDSKPCITDVATSPCDLDNTDILTTSRSITTPQDMPSVITLTVRQSITSDVEVTPTVKDSYLTSGTESSFIHLFDSTHLTDHEEILEGNSAGITFNGAAVITESAPSVSEISPSHGKTDALNIMSKSVTNPDVSCAIGTISSLPKENAMSGIFDNTIVNDNTSYENPDINNKTARSSIMDNQGVIPAEITNSDISDTTQSVSYVIETDTNHAMPYNSDMMTCSSDASEGHDSSDMTSTMSYVSDMPPNPSTTDTIEKFSIGNDIITNNDTYPTSGEIPSVIKVTTSPDVTENTAMLSAHQDIISIHDTNDIVSSVPVEIPSQINFAEEETNLTDNAIPIHNAPDTITAPQSASGLCLITTYDNENTENMAKTRNTICHDCTCTSRTILSVSDMPTSPDIDSTSEIILQTSDKNQNSDMFESQPCDISNSTEEITSDPDLTIKSVITNSLEIIITGPMSSDSEMVRNPVTSEETEMIQNVISDISANIIDKSEMKPTMNDTVTDHDFSIDSEKLSSQNDITVCDGVCYTTRIEQSVSDTHTNPDIIDNATMMSNAREITTICEFSDVTESLSSVGDTYPSDAVPNTADKILSVRGVNASHATKDMKEDTPTIIYVPTHHDVPDIPAIVPTVSINKDDEMADTTDIMQIESEELAQNDGLVNENTKKRIGDNKFSTSNGISDIIDRKATLTDLTMFRDILKNPDICPHFTDESASQSNSYGMSPSVSDMTTSKDSLVNTENMHENEQSIGQTIFDITENQPCPCIPSTNEMVSISNGIPTTQEHTNYSETIIYNVGMTGNNEITATTSDISTSQVVSQNKKNITEIISSHNTKTMADVPEGASVPSVNTNNEVMHTVESCDVCDITEPSPCITDTVICPEITDDIKLMTTDSEIISNCDVCDKGETIHFVSDITHTPGITNNLRPASANCDISTNHNIPDITETMSATDTDLIKHDKEIMTVSIHDVTYANNNEYIHRFSNIENNRDNAVPSARKTTYDVPVVEARPVIDYSSHGIANVGDVPTVRDCPTSQGLFGVDEKVSPITDTHSSTTNNENSGMVSYFNVHISDASDLSSAATDIVTNFSEFSANTDVTPTVICITKNGNKTEPSLLEDNSIICAAERRMSPDTITHSVNNLEDTGYTTFSWETPVSKDSAENVYEISQDPPECKYRNRRTFLVEPIMPPHESHADKYMSLQTSGDGIFNSHSVDDNSYLLRPNPNDNVLKRPLCETYAKSKKDDDCLPENEVTRLHLRTTVQEKLPNSDRGYSSCSPTATDALVPPTVLHETRSIREAISDLNLSVEQRRRRRGRLSKSSKSKVHTKPENSNGGYGIAVSKSKLSCTPNSTACREKESDCQSRTIGVFPGVQSTDKHLAITQVWDGNNATFVTVDYAIKKGILNLETASYMQNTNGDVFSLANAVALGLVQVNVQQSFEKDANMLPVYGLVTITSERKANTAHLTSLLDRENHVFSPDQPLLHEMGESLGEISRSGRHQMTDPALIKKDKQHNIAKTTSFYIIETVTNTETGQLMSFPEAIEANIIRPSIGSYFNSLSRRHISIMDAMASGYICYHKLSDNCSFMCSLNDKQTNIPEEYTQCLSFSECVSVSQLNRHVERVKNNTIKTPSVSLDITNKIEKVDRMIDSSIQQITTASTVAGVVDTVTKKIVFPLDALEMGLIKNARYVFRDTGKSITITQAVSQGLILFEHEQSALKRHTHDRLGLFTIETVRCSKVWTIRSAINLASGEELSPEEAADRGVLVMSTGKFRNFRSGTEHSLPEARELGYIICDSTSRDTTKTPIRREKYIVHSICDRQRNTFVSYLDAQQRHLLCPITGSYRDNVRKTSVPLAEAVIRGHVIATRSIEFPN